MSKFLFLKVVCLLSILLQITNTSVCAQKTFYTAQEDYLKANSIWAFGSYAGLDFNNRNNGVPIVIHTSMKSMEGCASVADTPSSLVLDTAICPGRDLVLKPVDNYQHQYIWDDGTTASERIIDKPGTYWLMQTNGCYTYIDTFIVKTLDFPNRLLI